MSGRDSIQSLLTRRKLTRAIADVVRTQITEYLATLGPLLRPHTVFGDHIEGGQKGSTRRADQALKDVQAQYEAIAPTKPFNLRRELSLPFSFSSPGIEITPVDYVHVPEAGSGAGTRRITVRRPLTWTMSYTGYAPTRLPELLDPRVRGEELQRFILSYLFMQQVIATQTGVARVLEALHFPVTVTKAPDFGDLPITRIGVGVSTERPADAVVVESADLTGMDSFEEVVNVEDIALLRDSLKERLADIARQHAPELAAP
jgi:hypothetical protein